MRNTTYRRWAIFYAAAAALLAGWLLLEKMPDGREELAESVENAFRRSGEVMERSNLKLLEAIQDGAEDYPSRQAEDYAKRAEKALVLAAAFENLSGEDGTAERLSVLRDSFLILADSDAFYQKMVEGFMGGRWAEEDIETYENLKADQLVSESRALAAYVLNYCATKISGYDTHCWEWYLAFEKATPTPLIGEAVQGGVFLSYFEPLKRQRCATTTAFLNDQPIQIKDGIAPLRTTFPTPGPHTLRLRFRRERCRDGSVTEVSRDFTVNVLERCNPND